jgi:hypothetical protein
LLFIKVDNTRLEEKVNGTSLAGVIVKLDVYPSARLEFISVNVKPLAAFVSEWPDARPLAEPSHQFPREGGSETIGTEPKWDYITRSVKVTQG